MESSTVYYLPVESCFLNMIFRHRGHGARRRSRRQMHSSVLNCSHFFLRCEESKSFLPRMSRMAADPIQFATDCLARSRNQIHTSVLILQKATKGTKDQGKSRSSLFPLLPFVKFRISNLLEIAEDKMHAGKHHLQIVRRMARIPIRGIWFYPCRSVQSVAKYFRDPH